MEDGAGAEDAPSEEVLSLMSNDPITWKDMLTLSVAMVGAVLGVINTWAALTKDRVRLKVIPAYALRTGRGVLTVEKRNTGPHDFPLVEIEVANLSGFAVTVAEVGFTQRGKSLAPGRHVLPPQVIDGKPWPRRLEPHETVAVYGELKALLENGAPIGMAFARTSSGIVRYGTSPALKELRLRRRKPL